MQTWWLKEQKPFFPSPSSLRITPPLPAIGCYLLKNLHLTTKQKQQLCHVGSLCISAHILAKLGKLIYMQIQTIDEFVDLI